MTDFCSSTLGMTGTSLRNGSGDGLVAPKLTIPSRSPSTWITPPRDITEDGKSPIWGYPPLPDKFAKLYPWQVDAIERIMEAFDNGARIVMAELSTGAGKSAIAECVRRLLGGNGVYLVATYDLQDQMIEGFPYTRMVRGRQAYPTLDYPRLFRDKWNPLSCAECTKQKIGNEYDDTVEEWICDFCSICSACPYEIAKREALAADWTTLTYKYFLTEANGPGRFSTRNYACADESDLIDQAILSHASVTISHRTITELGIEPPSHVTKSEKTDTEIWPQWVLNEAIPKVQAGIKTFPASNDVKSIRKRNQLLRLLKQLFELAEGLPLRNWVYESGRFKFDGTIEFKPIKVDTLAMPLLFSHAKRWLLMSATILEPHMERENLGIPEELCPLPEAFVCLPWIFPAKNRPVKYPLGMTVDMTNKNKDESWPKMTESVRKCIDQRPGARILIHTVSYKLASFLVKTIDNPRLMTYYTSDERQEVLEQYKQTPGAVLVAPSFSRGIDLADDLARCVIICKVPWGNIGDKQIAARMYKKGGKLWYETNAIRDLVQMSGRGVRHFEDTCEIIILDQQFRKRIWKDCKRILPQGFKDALDESEGIVWR